MLGFTCFAELKKTAYAVWRLLNPGRWSKTYWRLAKQACPNNTEGEWLEWLIQLQAPLFINLFFDNISEALLNLPKNVWLYHYRRELLIAIMQIPRGLDLLMREYNGRTEKDWVQGLEGETRGLQQFSSVCRELAGSLGSR